MVISKYRDYQPLYRQNHIFARSGVDIPVSTLAGWVGTAGVVLEPLAVVRCVFRELRRDDACQLAGTRVAAFNGFGRHGGLNDVVTPAAGQFWPLRFDNLKGAADELQALDEQAQAVSISPQDFNHITPSATEDKYLPRERVIFQRILHLRGKTVEPVAHVDDPGHYSDTCSRWQHTHCAPAFLSLISMCKSSGVRLPRIRSIPEGSSSSQ